MRTALARIVLALALAGAVIPATAQPAQPLQADAALEARVARLAAELRCLVCQNQSLADSNAELAVQLKGQVREQLGAGRSEDQVLAFMTERYGDFVLYRPPVRASTALLWAGPGLLMLAGGWALWFGLRRLQAVPDELDPAAAARAAALLAGDDAASPAPSGSASSR